MIDKRNYNKPVEIPYVFKGIADFVSLTNKLQKKRRHEYNIVLFLSPEYMLSTADSLEMH